MHPLHTYSRISQAIGKRVRLRILYEGSEPKHFRENRNAGLRTGYISEHPDAAPVLVDGTLEGVEVGDKGWLDVYFVGLEFPVYLTSLTRYTVEALI
jgi:hypothetical protein